MATFLATSYYSGALNIGDMRTFETEEESWKYVDSGELSNGQFRVYELFPDKPPRLCKRPKTK